MAKRKSGKKSMKKSAKKVTGKAKEKASLSASRGHKPVELLETFRNTMEENVQRLNTLIKKRKAAGE